MLRNELVFLPTFSFAHFLRRSSMGKFIESVAAQPMLTTEATAALLGLHPGTLRNARSSKALDLPFIRIGGAIRYQLEDVLAFLDAHKEGGAI
jgi:hypothetical protein